MKELFVIEETCWMQILVDLSAGCIEFLWRCVTVVKQMRSFMYWRHSNGHLVASLSHQKLSQGSYRWKKKICSNIKFFTPLEMQNNPENCLKWFLNHKLALGKPLLVSTHLLVSSLSINWMMCSFLVTFLLLYHEFKKSDESWEKAWYSGKGKHVGTLKSGNILYHSWFELYV